MAKTFDILTGRFRCKNLEAEYKRFGFVRDRKHNVTGLLVAAILVVLYTALDVMSLIDAEFAIAVRAAAVFVVFVSAYLIRFTKYDQYQEELTSISIVAIGLALNAIIWKEPNLDGSYYVGLIQVAV